MRRTRNENAHDGQKPRFHASEGGQDRIEITMGRSVMARRVGHWTDFDRDPECVSASRSRKGCHELAEEPMRLVFSMKTVDELQFWSCMLIMAHCLAMRGQRGCGGFENELVGAIKDLGRENLSKMMRGCLSEIAEGSPNELARAAAKKRLAECGL